MPQVPFLERMVGEEKPTQLSGLLPLRHKVSIPKLPAPVMTLSAELH